MVTYPPLNALQKLEPRDTIHPIYFGDEASLYVHIAFCETMCTFCHYAVKHYRGKEHSPPSRTDAVERYLNAHKIEMKDWAFELQSSETVINSIYIGGGTPLVLEREQLIDLLQTIRSEFNVRADAEICVEASPLTITAEGGLEKLRALKQHGATRLSFGVQSFDDEVLRRAARGYKRETAILACKLAGQVWEELADMGYHQIDGNRFVLDERYTDPFKKVRTSVNSNLLGVGASSYSHVDMRPHPRWFTVPEGVFFRNTPDINDDVARIESGDGAVGSALALGWNEYLAASYVVGLRTGRLEAENQEWASPELIAHYAELERQFLDLGLLETFDAGQVHYPQRGLRLSRLGQLLEDEVLSMFYSLDVQELLSEAG